MITGNGDDELVLLGIQPGDQEITVPVRLYGQGDVILLVDIPDTGEFFSAVAGYEGSILMKHQDLIGVLGIDPLPPELCVLAAGRQEQGR